MKTKNMKTKKMSLKKLVLTTLIFIGVILLTSNVLAKDYSLICLEKGETIKFSECNPLMSDKSCTSSGYCSYCTYIGTKGKPCPANINQCNALGSSCTYTGGDGPIDRVPPVMAITSPTEEMVYSSKSVYFRGRSDKVTTWYYKDNNDRRPKWKKMCRATTYCVDKNRFDEGLNDISFLSIDALGNSVESDISFRIDSKKPKIKKTYPKRGFASGLFEVEFQELNPASLVLHYGNEEVELDLNSCNECKTVKKKTVCTKTVNVSEYNKGRIPYYFELEDVAGIKVRSKTIYLNVDTSPPKILNPESFWRQEGKYVYFDIKINEPNLDEVVYFYKDRRGKVKEKRLCSRLKNGKCEKRKTFKDGEELMNIFIVDEAGNSAVGEIGLDIKY
jgi:hypothetical protein